MPEPTDSLTPEEVANLTRAPEGIPRRVMFTVHSRDSFLSGPPSYGGVPMVEVMPVWYVRLWHALTPWRVRTRVFMGGTDAWLKGVGWL